MDLNENEEWEEFRPEPSNPDMLKLSLMVQRADAISQAVKRATTEQEQLKNQLKTLIEEDIPSLMSNCGLAEFKTPTGLYIKVTQQSFANVPSLSAIEDEKDDDRRAELLDRRHKGLAILEDKAPALIKRKFEIQFEKDDVEEARAFEDMLDSVEGMPPVVKGLSVHPATLTKWINEVKETGYNFTEEEVYAFGIYPRRVAKIKK